MKGLGYDTECAQAAEAFSRFLAELHAMSHGFDGSDADLAVAIRDALPSDSGFEATFDMIARGYAVAQKVAA